MIRVLFFIRMTMSRTIQRICLFLFCLPVFGSCMKWDYGEMEDFSVSASGLFITNEGNFQYSNATLSYYDPATCEVENEVFYRACRDDMESTQTLEYFTEESNANGWEYLSDGKLFN